MNFEDISYLVFFSLGCVTQLVSTSFYVKKLDWLDRVFADRLIESERNYGTIDVKNPEALRAWKDEQVKFMARENAIRLALLVFKMFGLGLVYVLIGTALHKLFW